MKFPEISRTTLLLDQDIARSNIRRMKMKADKASVELRPHFKTHQAHEIGSWFREEGVAKITVSSLAMAEYFAEDGWNDITLAIPVNPREIGAIDRLAGEIRLNLLCEDAETIAHLGEKLSHQVGIFLKIDVGTGRTGLPWDQPDRPANLAELIRKYTRLEFAGLLAHAGHTYGARGKEEVLRIHHEYLERLAGLRQSLDCQLSVGDTPSCSLAEDFGPATEIRPGNFVFYDLMQVGIGSCPRDQVAVSMLCPVIALHPERAEAVVHGGAVHFSKDGLIDEKGAFFGEAFAWQGDPEEKLTGSPVGILRRLSQEHGIIEIAPDLMEYIKVGDMLRILPIHSCLTADCMQAYLTKAGELIRIMRKA